MKKVFVVITEGQDDFNTVETVYSSAFINKEDALAEFKKQRDAAYSETEDYNDDLSIYDDFDDSEGYYSAQDYDNGWGITVWIKELPLIE